MAMPFGFLPEINGEPGTGVRAPVVGSSVKPDTVETFAGRTAVFATYTNLPDGSTPTATGLSPVANGEPLTSARLPVDRSMAYTETLFENLFTAKTK